MSEQEQQQVGLSLQDIAAAVQVVDLASSRGAIRGDEMMAVGSLRERFVAFLRAAQQQGQKVEIPGEEAPEEEASAEEAA
jgi:hypothetical protein